MAKTPHIPPQSRTAIAVDELLAIDRTIPLTLGAVKPLGAASALPGLNLDDLHRLPRLGPRRDHARPPRPPVQEPSPKLPPSVGRQYHVDTATFGDVPAHPAGFFIRQLIFRPAA